MRLYLSGGIKNVPNHIEIFDEEYKKLIRAHFEIINPIFIVKCYFKNCNGTQDSNAVYHHTWECSLKYDIAELVFCEGIAMIPGWESSAGANLELDIIRRLNLPFNTVDGWVYGKEELTYSELSHAYTLVLPKESELR